MKYEAIMKKEMMASKNLVSWQIYVSVLTRVHVYACALIYMYGK